MDILLLITVAAVGLGAGWLGGFNGGMSRGFEEGWDAATALHKGMMRKLAEKHGKEGQP